MGFSFYLTYIEAKVLEVWCIYCVISLTLITTITLLAVISLLVNASKSRRAVPV